MHLFFVFLVSFASLLQHVASKFQFCATCSNSCPARGQFLFSFGIAEMGSDSKFIKYTDAYHADWEVSATTLPTGSTRMDVLMGEKRVGVHYIITFYYASPDVGVNELSIWLDSPDVCSMLLEHADITPQNLLGAMVSHTKSQASRNNMCSLDVNLPSYTTLGNKPYATFTERDFRYHNPIYTDDGGHFKAEYFIQKEMMYIQASESHFELDTFIFNLRHFSRGPFQISLRSGEACWMFLPDNARWDKDYIQVYLANSV
jgi:hypothetical protein